MGGKFNALLIAWALTFIILLGTVMTVELTYHPSTDAQTGGENGTEQSGAHGDAPQTQPSHTPTNSEAEHTQPDAHGNDTHASNTQSDTPHTQATDENHAAEIGPGSDHTATAGAGHSSQEPHADTANTNHAAAPTEQITIRQPDPKLIEQSSTGPLPRIASDGTLPAEFYAAPIGADEETPRIAILVTELGQRSNITQNALNSLPRAVSVAFSPYASNLDRWTEIARNDGREYLMMLPMEPVNYPQNDPGPFSLFVDQTPTQNLALLHSVMGQTTGYVGLINHMGSRFTAAAESLRPILEDIRARGLVFVDSRSTRYSRAGRMGVALGLSVAQNDRYIDNSLTEADILRELGELEARARSVGAAVGIARPYAVSLKTIEKWQEGLKERGVQLVPITAVIGYQPIS